MKASKKLDLLHSMARQYSDNAHALYLIQLLADHVDEEEETELFLRKVKAIIPYLTH